MSTVQTGAMPESFEPSELEPPSKPQKLKQSTGDAADHAVQDG